MREFPWACWPTKGDEDAPWRTHSCVPRSHSCERLGSVATGVRKSANTARRSACATIGLRRINNFVQASSTESVLFRCVAIHDCPSSLARPRAVRATWPSSIVSPHSTTSIRRSTRASSQTECRGHVLRQASIASAYVLGRVEIQVRSSRINGSGIACHDRALLRAKSSPKVIKLQLELFAKPLHTVPCL